MISKTGLRAIHALAALATLPRDRFTGASTIANNIDAPRNYLSKLLHVLGRAGLVESQKGRRGGFRLARSPETISLLEVIAPLEDTTRWNHCLLGQAECSDEKPCAVHDNWKQVRDGYLGLLSRTTVADLVQPSTRRALDEANTVELISRV